MKRNLRNSLILAAAALLAAPLFTSCVVDDDGWYPAPPAGWNYFYDDYLNGRWQLVQVDGRPVSTYNTNYMDFYGNGRGTYYYYRNNRLYSEDMAYYCQDTNYGPSGQQINIQYEYDSPVTMYYWFTGDTLWLQWSTNSGPVTYLYRPVNSLPYPY
ncbi:MAG: hypothetical protein HDS43_01555 [Bacteroides sp.]|nr:hypothetical protein [Bacteroides sp.]